MYIRFRYFFRTSVLNRVSVFLLRYPVDTPSNEAMLQQRWEQERCQLANIDVNNTGNALDKFVKSHTHNVFW